jgi:hypothetical protein
LFKRGDEKIKVTGPFAFGTVYEASASLGCFPSLAQVFDQNKDGE